MTDEVIKDTEKMFCVKRKKLQIFTRIGKRYIYKKWPQMFYELYIAI